MSGSAWRGSGRRGRFAAVDLGASSGRVVVGGLTTSDEGPVLAIEVVSRFTHDAVRRPADEGGRLTWDLPGLFESVLDGLRRAVPAGSEAPVASIGIDSWAVDFGLVGGGGPGGLLAPVVHYRDEGHQRGVERVHAVVGPEELYARNGLQHLPFTTLFQLAALASATGDAGVLQRADQLLLVPDLLASWLCGARVAERTNASTTGLLDPRTGEWNLDLVARLGLPPRLLPPLVDPGTPLGAVLPDVARRLGYSSEVVAVASHDTASAVVAVPAAGERFAYISCGTWGLVGLELAAPVITEQARVAGFTNERGVGGTTRFLHNVMGLWVLNECVRAWQETGPVDLPALLAEASRRPVPAGLVDVDDPRFLAPNDGGHGSMPERIADWCREHTVAVPDDRAGWVRLVVESLAEAFARAVRAAADLADRQVDGVHLVGGGAQNELLCRRTAARLGVPVVAGPVEATAIGNLLVQARAAGLVGESADDLRAVVRRSVSTVTHLPGR
ncbi:rhamnulokinase [Aestuariimicrobium soli]|uniref:rhamnulokinase n=1 Tax=Aestuariimicrobium soli TaxID=2035834 RepID=UPI003EBEEF99